eukprot:262298-Prymnesium_polylepis.1
MVRIRCSDAALSSTALSPRRHTMSSAIAKSDFSTGMNSPELTTSPTFPIPPLPVPTLCPLTRISSDPTFVPHITTQSVMGETCWIHFVRIPR